MILFKFWYWTAWLTISTWAIVGISWWLHYHRFPHWSVFLLIPVSSALIVLVFLRQDEHKQRLPKSETSNEAPDYATPSHQVKELLLQNKKIHAVKAYIQETGLSLKEAKSAVDKFDTIIRSREV